MKSKIQDFLEGDSWLFVPLYVYVRLDLLKEQGQVQEEIFLFRITKETRTKLILIRVDALGEQIFCLDNAKEITKKP